MIMYNRWAVLCLIRFRTACLLVVNVRIFTDFTLITLTTARQRENMIPPASPFNHPCRSAEELLIKSRHIIQLWLSITFLAVQQVRTLTGENKALPLYSFFVYHIDKNQILCFFKKIFLIALELLYWKCTIQRMASKYIVASCLYHMCLVFTCKF